MNQRVFSRVQVRHDADAIFGTQSYSVHITNIGLGGFFVENAPEAELGSEWRVEIPLLGHEPELRLVMLGKVRRIDSTGLAMSIEKIEPADLCHLRNLVAYNAPDADQIFSEADGEEGSLRLVGQLSLRETFPA